MTAVDLAALALAAGQAVDTWRQGAVFAAWRRRVAFHAKIPPLELDGPTFLQGYPAWADWTADRLVNLGHAAARMLDCRYCFTHWAAAALVAGCVLPGLVWPAAAAYLMLPVYALAATRAFVLVDGLVPTDDDVDDVPPPGDFVDVVRDA